MIARRLSVMGFAAVLAVALAGAGCGSASPTAATVKIGGRTVEIDRSDFERELEALVKNKPLQEASGGSGLSGAGKDTADPRLAAGWLTAVIYDKLITHEFDRRKLTLTPADTEAGEAQLASQFGNEDVAKAFPKWFQDRLIERNARAVAVRTALSGISLTEESIRRYFDEHKADFGQNCVSHILVRTKAEADQVLARVKGGADFAAVAQETSTDPGSRTKGGDLGCNPKGVFVPEFDQAASELPIGQVSDPPVQTQFGFHVILVRERKEASYEDAKEQARAALNSETQTAFRQFLSTAVKDAKVTVDKRYGTFEAPAQGQAPEVVPPNPPQPKTRRTDNQPASGGQESDGSDADPTAPSE